MRPLIIGDDERKKIRRLIDYAHKHIFDMKKMKKLTKGNIRPAGERKEFVIFLPIGFRIVYSLEEHPMGLMKHLSISVEAAGRYPSIEAVIMILKEFGFNSKIGDKNSKIYEEKEYESINRIERYENGKNNTNTYG